VPISLAVERGRALTGDQRTRHGGKTVALKTIGLAALSAQAGIPVAAQRVVLPLFDRLLVDIGDEQSIAADLPRFRRTC